MFTRNDLAPKIAQILNTKSLNDIDSAEKLYDLAKRYDGPLNAPYKQYVELASALKNYCKSSTQKKKAYAAKDLVLQVLSHQLFPILTNNWRNFENYIEIIASKDINEGVRFTQGISSIAREVAGNIESQRLLAQVEQLTNTCKPDLKYTLLVARANNSKDAGDYKSAEKLYHQALKFGQEFGLPLAPLKLQLGRLELELGRDIKKAVSLFDQAINEGFERLGESDANEIYTRTAKIQALGSLGATQDAHESFSRALSRLNPLTVNYSAEAGLHHSMIELSTYFAHELLHEWLSRISATAKILSGVKRELDSAIIEIARAVASSSFPTESIVLVNYAKANMKALNMAISEPSQLATLGHIYRASGDYQQAIEQFTKSAAIEIHRNDIDGAVSSLLQAAICERISGLNDYHITLKTIDELKLKKPDIDSVAGLQLGYLDGIKLLNMHPSKLERWQNIIDNSASHNESAFAPLKAVLKRRLHFVQDANIKYSPVQETALLIQLMQNVIMLSRQSGYLPFIKRQFGVSPREAVLWVFSDIKEFEAQKRILLESLVDTSGLEEQCRYSAVSGGRKWVEALPELRAFISRWLFESVVNNKSPDVTALTNFYDKWRKYDAANDLQLQNAELSSNLEKISRRRPEKNHYLDSVIFKHLSHKRDANTLYVIHQLQKNDELIWTLVKMGRDFSATTHRNVQVKISRRKAGSLAGQIQSFMQREEYGQLSNHHLIASYHLLLFSKLTELTQPLAKLISDIPKDARVLIKLASPWNSIPFEQLPLFPNGEGLIDVYHITRMDSFGFWPQSEKDASSVNIKQNAVLSAGFEGSSTNKLPVENHRKMLQEVFGDIRSATSFEELKQQIGTAAILDFMGHGSLNDVKGVKEIFSMEFSDETILPQELAATEIKNCNLIVLNSCNLALNPLNEEAITESIPNMTDHLFVAGARSIIAALSILNAASIEGYMKVLYSEILAGVPLSKAARASWGLKARMEQGRMLCPLAVFGKNVRFNFEKR